MERWLVVVVAGVIAASGLAMTTPAHARQGPAMVVLVDTTADTFDGLCDAGGCSLRDAVAAAPDGAIVRVPSGYYALTLRGVGGAGVGDINVSRSITIAGTGETGAFIDASSLGQWAFSVKRGGIEVTLRGLTIFGAQSGDLRTAGVWVDGGSVRLHAVTITSGRARRGGAISVGADGALQVHDSLLIGGTAATRGGAIWVAGEATITDSALVAGRAERGGAIWASPASTVTVDGSTLSGNRATGTGGAMWTGGHAALDSVTVAGNRAEHGAAIVATAGARVRVGHTVVASNHSGAGGQCVGRLTSLGFNVEDGRRCGFGRPSDQMGTDPLLRPLGSNGGPTPTRALAAASPAIDVGGTCGPRDQRGAPRERCDAGAYERVLCLGRAVNIVGTPGDDELSGGRHDDVFLGQAGDDEFQGSLGSDRICGGPGDDRLLNGGPGNDRIEGGSGDDLLAGEQGRDRLDGGRGRDRCLGGSQRDRAVRCEVVAGVPRR